MLVVDGVVVVVVVASVVVVVDVVVVTFELSMGSGAMVSRFPADEGALPPKHDVRPIGASAATSHAPATAPSAIRTSTSGSSAGWTTC